MIDQLLKSEVQKFIQEHEYDDPVALALQGHKFLGIPIKEAIQQIKSRQTARIKLPEWHSKPGIIFPPTLSMEQCSSELTAKFKSALVSGETLVDLTGGTGIDTFYMGQSFKRALFVERDPALCKIADHNFSILGADHIKVLSKHAAQFLQEDSPQVDWIYIDPARRDDHHGKVFKLSDCVPDVLELKEIFFKHSDNVLIKTSPMLDIKQAISQLEYVKKVFVVSVKNDCKEVLYMLKKNATSEPEIVTVNLLGEQRKQQFSFYRAAESGFQIALSAPLSFIYEPNASILKARGFNAIADAFQVNKLNINSHLYTSQKLIEDFPGRIFKCTHITRLDKKEIIKFIPEKKANVTTRNFPYSVKEIRKKTGLKDGGNTYLFATKGPDEKPVILVCEKVGFSS
ncbi:RsmD family RNA methyltransferase [Fulvivirgaceae bacterium BMA10]|uniref:RsmD family RNA methyltransferase n=1 Tax=Splendidivirga corallicola TaxID=3051826 RepID=A0ABT8KSW9_9BACT|nr:RsmD family RNA methyltransferase [Fulvivirgaceae bacterium BMA10]